MATHPRLSYLSYQSALVIIPSAEIQEPLQKIRESHDKQFQRWPPHIKLIYPFVADPTDSPQTQVTNSTSLSPHLRNDVFQRVRKIAKEWQPFTIAFNPWPRWLYHGRDDVGIAIRPSEVTSRSWVHSTLCGFRAALKGEFKECDADFEAYDPYLPIAECASDKKATEVYNATEQVLGVSQYTNWPDFVEQHALKWKVDRIYVLERSAFKEPFRIVGEVPLG